MDSQLAPDTVMLPETGVTAELYRAAIGPRGQDYYLKHFIRFDTLGKTTATWHWPAYWATLNWLIYRRMWRWALAYAAAVLSLVLVIFGVGKLVFSYNDFTALILFLSLLTAAFAVPGLYANAWFYNFCNEKISAALRGTAEVANACELLSVQASNKQRWYAMVGANLALVALVAGVATLVLDATPDAPVAAATAKPGDEPLGELAQHVVASDAVSAVPAVTPVTLPPVESVPPPMAVPPVAPVSVPVVAAAAPAVVTTPVAEPSPVTPAVAVPAAAEPQVPAVVRRPKSKSRSKAAKPATTTSAIAEPAVAPSVAPVKHHWLVQVGAFSQESNAQSVRTKIEEAGLQTMAEPGDAVAGQLIRVRVGPFDTKAEAENAALRLRALELPTVLVRQ